MKGFNRPWRRIQAGPPTLAGDTMGVDANRRSRARERELTMALGETVGGGGSLAHQYHLRTAREIALNPASDILPSVGRIEPHVAARQQAAQHFAQHAEAGAQFHARERLRIRGPMLVVVGTFGVYRGQDRTRCTIKDVKIDAVAAVEKCPLHRDYGGRAGIRVGGKVELLRLFMLLPRGIAFARRLAALRVGAPHQLERAVGVEEAMLEMQHRRDTIAVEVRQFVALDVMFAVFVTIFAPDDDAVVYLFTVIGGVTDHLPVVRIEDDKPHRFNRLVAAGAPAVVAGQRG